MEQLLLLAPSEARKRIDALQALMRREGMDAVLVSDNANLLALCGRVYAGYAWIPADGEPVWFVRRPVELGGDNVVYIHKPENIPAYLSEASLKTGDTVGLEYDITAYSAVLRLMGLFPDSKTVNASGVLRQWRSVKTPVQAELMRQSGVKHAEVYKRVPGLFRMGMTDHELQVEIERLSRLEGCLGVFA